jgi:hypothetical protein
MRNLEAAAGTLPKTNDPMLREYQKQRLILEKTVANAEAYGCGNCGEQSAIAFAFLRR